MRTMTQRSKAVMIMVIAFINVLHGVAMESDHSASALADFAYSKTTAFASYGVYTAPYGAGAEFHFLVNGGNQTQYYQIRSWPIFFLSLPIWRRSPRENQRRLSFPRTHFRTISVKIQAKRMSSAAPDSDSCTKEVKLEISNEKISVESSIDAKLSNGNANLNANGTLKPFRIFVGYDPREDLAYEVCKFSILKRSSIPVEVNPIKQSELRENGLYWRERGKLESTEFSFTRFLTPFLANFDGWAMFVDCDFLYLADINELVDLIDDKYAIMCVQHDYAPKQTTKMDGAIQTVYPRKNWSSMVLYNCGHPKNGVLTPETVNSQTGAFLHRFQWLEDDEIGSIPFVWNFLVGHNKVVESDPSSFPKAIHYTLGGPWFEAWKDCEFADLWVNEMEEYEKAAKENVVE
ncbi:hypothetical protein Nepgr_019511 [Nepenthes gracilis]|uniref:Glycosyltransferase n=1 Tax=Nepenthes gracilis TaxID=150966 RepID=A0AAD3XVB4_NEPGR|nr:hypothetical protein Nepgr_019511 [Nepenthes gracilis]